MADTGARNCNFTIMVHPNPKDVFTPEELKTMPNQLRELLKNMGGKTSLMMKDEQGHETIYVFGGKATAAKVTAATVAAGTAAGTTTAALEGGGLVFNGQLGNGTGNFQHDGRYPGYISRVSDEYGNGVVHTSTNGGHVQGVRGTLGYGSFGGHLEADIVGNMPSIAAATLGFGLAAAALTPNAGKVIVLPAQFNSYLDKDTASLSYDISREDFNKLNNYLGTQDRKLYWPIKGSASAQYATGLAKEAGVELDVPKVRTSKALKGEIENLAMPGRGR